jgi:hypothetical protein
MRPDESANDAAASMVAAFGRSLLPVPHLKVSLMFYKRTASNLPLLRKNMSNSHHPPFL